MLQKLQQPLSTEQCRIKRRIWQQITDIFAECSIDYNRDSDTAYHFYATIQNKFHYAITGKTAAEIVYNQADHTKENMGLTTWKNAPDGRILKSDTPIAKNYLDEKQIRQLERAVTGYFDYIEDLIERENVFTMEEFLISFLDYVIMIQLRKIVFYESDQSNFLCKGELYEKDISDRRNNFCK